MASNREGTTADHGIDTSVTAPIVDALHCLDRAIEGSELYADEHPAIISAVKEGSAHLGLALTSREPLTLGISQGQILYKNTELPETAALRGLADLLHNMDLAVLELHRALSQDQFAQLVRAVVKARRDLAKGHTVADAIAERTQGAVTARPVAYDAFTVVDHARQESDTERRLSWTDLIDSLINPTHGGHGATPEQLAEQAELMCEGDTAAGVDALHLQLNGLADSVANGDTPADAQGQERLQEFLSALNPRLRGALLNTSTSRINTSLRLVDEMTDVLPVDEVLDALKRVDLSSLEPSKDSLRLFKKLAGYADGHPENHHRFTELIHPNPDSSAPPSPDAAEPATLGTTDTELPGQVGTGFQASLVEILHQRSSAEFSPTEYQKLLDELSNSTEECEHVPTYDRSFNADGIGPHAAQIAIHLADAEPGGSAYTPGLFRHIKSTTASLLSQGQFDLVHNAVRSAQSLLHHPGSDENKHAAQDYLLGFTSEPWVRAIHTGIGAGTDSSDRACDLLRLGGANALGHFVHIQTETPNSQALHTLEELMRGGTTAGIQPVLLDIASHDSEQLHQVYASIKPSEPNEQFELLEPLIISDLRSVRAEGFSLLDEHCTEWPTQLIQLALTDEDRANQDLGVRHLTEQNDAASIEMIGAFLEGKMTDTLPQGRLFDRVVTAAIRRKGQGLGLLCEALRSLRSSANPRKAALSKRLALALEHHRHDPEVRKALLRWRFSLGHLVSILPTRATRNAEASR